MGGGTFVLSNNKEMSAKNDDVECIHRNIALWSGAGAAVLTMVASSYTPRNNSSVYIKGLLAFFYTVGLVLIVLSISWNRDGEREKVGSDIPTLYRQIKRRESGPDRNYPALLSSLSAIVLLGSAYYMVSYAEKGRSMVGLPMLLYAGGWCSMAVSASTHDKDLTELRPERLYWTLGGAAGIVLGTALLDWQWRRFYAGPAVPLIALGLISLTVGNSLVEDPVV